MIAMTASASRPLSGTPVSASTGGASLPDQQTNGVPILEVQDVYKMFPIRGGLFLKQQSQASVLNGISFQLGTGEILGIVGESGCGKSTLARLLMRIFPATSGEMRFEGKSIQDYLKKDYFHQVQMIFQDPFSSLNPKMTVATLLDEIIQLHQPNQDTTQVRSQLLDEVGLPKESEKKYPHEFSGGQRQRIAIARALAAQPKLLIADEPVSALDVSIQAQILNLLSDLQKSHRLSLVFISHDLEVVDYFCDRILVIYLGRIVEELSGNALQQAQHPYTQALLRSIPDPHKKAEGLQVLQGELPSPLNLPPGCGFYSRCEHRQPVCQQRPPHLERHAPGHQVACFAVSPPSDSDSAAQ